MSSCKKIDALMVDWLYDELDAATKAQFKEHVDDCATCRAEMASLARIREMFSDLPELEPPAAGQAILMHEAAKRAPAAKRHDEQSLWGRIMDLFRPVLAHPALAAAASLVLVVTVAGSLYLRGKSQVAKPVVHPSVAPLQAEGVWAPDQDPAGQEQDIRGTIDNLAGDQAAKQEAPAEDQDNDILRATGQRNDKAPGKASGKDGYRAGMDGEAVAEEDQADVQSIAVDRSERELALKTLPESKPLDAKRDAPARTASKKAPRVQQKNRSSYAKAKGNSVPLDGLLDTDDAFAAPPPPDNKLSATSPGSVASGESTTSTASGVRGGGVEAEKVARRRAVAPAPKTAAKPTKRETRAPEPAVGPYQPARPSAPAIRSEPQLGRASQKSAKADLAWAQAQHKKLEKSVRSKRCGDAARIAVDILERNPSYYYRFINNATDFKRCQQYVAVEQRRRAARKARSKAAQSDEAASEAAADTAE